MALDSEELDTEIPSETTFLTVPAEEDDTEHNVVDKVVCFLPKNGYSLYDELNTVLRRKSRNYRDTFVGMRLSVILTVSRRYNDNCTSTHLFSNARDDNQFCGFSRDGEESKENNAE